MSSNGNWEPERPEDVYSALPGRCICGGRLCLTTNGRVGLGLTYYRCELSADGGVHDTKLWDKVVTDELLRLRNRVDNVMEIRTSGIESKVDNITELLDDWGDQLSDMRRYIAETRRLRSSKEGAANRLYTKVSKFLVLCLTSTGTMLKEQINRRPMSCATFLCFLLNVCLVIYFRHVYG